MPKTAILIGAGPAGLTSALEFLRRSDVHPIVLEASHEIGGISRTVKHNGNRIDIGGHRFFSKSDRVMNWWLRFMPIAEQAAVREITYQGSTRRVVSQRQTDGDADRVMLVRNRKSRLYF